MCNARLHATEGLDSVHHRNNITATPPPHQHYPLACMKTPPLPPHKRFSPSIANRYPFIRGCAVKSLQSESQQQPICFASEECTSNLH
jgi:hypothetical protein